MRAYKLLRKLSDNHKEIHGFKTPKETEYYMKSHPEEIFGKYPLILFDSENNV